MRHAQSFSNCEMHTDRDPDVYGFDNEEEVEDDENSVTGCISDFVNEAFEYNGAEFCANMKVVGEEDVICETLDQQERGEFTSRFIPRPEYSTNAIVLAYQHPMTLTFAVHLKRFANGRAVFEISSQRLRDIMKEKKPIIAPYRFDKKDKIGNVSMFKIRSAMLRNITMEGPASAMYIHMLTQQFSNDTEPPPQLEIRDGDVSEKIAALITKRASAAPLGNFTPTSAHPQFGAIFGMHAGASESLPEFFFNIARPYVPGTHAADQRYDVNKTMYRVPCKSFYAAAVAIAQSQAGLSAENMFRIEDTSAGKEFIIDGKCKTRTDDVIRKMYNLAPNSELTKDGFRFEVVACGPQTETDRLLGFSATLELSISMMVVHYPPPECVFLIDLGELEF